MKWSFSSVGVITLGIIGIFIILLFAEITISNEQDYYLMKKAAEASMIESIDVAYYRLTGGLKISQEKFVESFTKRFYETARFGSGNYQIDFYQINEEPPMVNLKIIDKTKKYNIFFDRSIDVDSTEVDVVNKISAILDGYKLIEDEKGVE